MPESEQDKQPARLGRVRHDAGGRAIWEWAVDSGRHAIDSTSRLLKKLDVTSLRLLGDEEKTWQKKAAEAAAASSGETSGAQQFELQPEPTAPAEIFGGPLEVDRPAAKRESFNPYDSRMPSRRVSGPPAKAATKTGTAKPANPKRTIAAAPARRGFIARLFGLGKK